MPLDLPLTHGGAIRATPDEFTIVDHVGAEFVFGVLDANDLATLFDFTRRGTNGIDTINIHGTDVVIAWVSNREGDCWLYAHTMDRATCLAPLYITAGERALLAHRSI